MTYTDEEVLKSTLEYFDGDELAASVWIGKYALRNAAGELLEKTPDDMHKRMAKEFARIEQKYENPISYEEIYELFKSWKVVPQGSPMFGVGNPIPVSVANCFVVPLQDSYGSIMAADASLAGIYRRRGGCGLDLSAIRPIGLPVQNAAGSTTGIIPFMERFSNTTREVGQNSRRGALMESISIHHPEVESFIEAKMDETKVTGANISVRLTDEFMKAVQTDGEYEQRWPVTLEREGHNCVVCGEYQECDCAPFQPIPVSGQIRKWVKARDLWNKIVHCAWFRAEPGILFWDNVINNGPSDAYEKHRSVSTNPCCFSVDSNPLVVTNKGLVKLQEMTSEHKVWIDTSGVWADTSGYFQLNGKHDVYRVTFDVPGLEFELTPNHKLYRYAEGLVELRDLKIGDEILIQEMESGYLEPLTLNDFVRITNIEFLGQKTVGCISVPGYEQFTADGVISGNSEIPLSEYDACRLLVLNVSKYVVNPFQEDSYFDFETFAKDSKIAQRLMDDLVDLELEKIDMILEKIESDPEPEYTKYIEKYLWNQIKEKALSGRRTGLGVTAIGDTMAMLNLRYASDESIQKIEEIYKTLEVSAWISSCQMAAERGAFPDFDFDVEKDHEFINKVVSSDPELSALYAKHGRRNISLTTTAPCGSISILAQTTSGIEPAFMLQYKRRKKVSDQESEFDFVDKVGDRWKTYDVYHHGFKQWMDITGKSEIEESPYHLSTANEIDWIAGVKLQAAAQRWVDHSISRTTNVPNDTSEEVIGQIYMEAWKQGCKGFTVYRDGCRSGVLISSDSPQESQEVFPHHSAPSRPEELPCEIHHSTIKGEKWTIFVGLLDGKPYEVFGGLSDKIELPKKYATGVVRKHPRKTVKSVYDLVIGDDEPLVIKNIVEQFDNPNYGTHTRLISLSLRHGSSVEYVVSQLQKDKDSDMFGFSRVLARVLKKYIPDGTSSTGDKVCTECKTESLIYQDGCITCSSCGWSRCS